MQRQLKKLEEILLFTRPIYSGKAFEKKIVTEGIIFATIRPNNIAPLEKDEVRTGEISPFQLILKIYVQSLKKLYEKPVKVLICRGESGYFRWTWCEK